MTRVASFDSRPHSFSAISVQNVQHRLMLRWGALNFAYFFPDIARGGVHNLDTELLKVGVPIAKLPALEK